MAPPTPGPTDGNPTQALQSCSAWYRAVPALKGRGALTYHIGEETHRGSLAYALGAGADATFFMDDYGGCLLGHTAWIQQSDKPEVLTVVEGAQTLPQALDDQLGNVFYLPPQLILRLGPSVEEAKEAMGLGLITGLRVSAAMTVEASPGGLVNRIQLQGDQGTVTVLLLVETCQLRSLHLAFGEVRLDVEFEEERFDDPEGVVVIHTEGMTLVRAPSRAHSGPIVPGDRAPSLDLLCLDGTRRALTDSEGTIVVLDFWALWCSPCLRSMPHLDALARRWTEAGSTTQVWTVAIVDAKEETAAGEITKIEALWQRKGLSLPVLLDRGGEAFRAFGFKAVPTTIVVGEDGIVRLAESGLEPRQLEARLAAPPQA